jgi:pyruvate,water dikinase
MVSAVVRALRWLWAKLLLFLEVIGLRSAPREDPSAQLARLRVSHTEFRKLLSSNDAFLTLVSELEQKLFGGETVNRPYLERRAVEASVAIFRVVAALEAIAPGRHPGLQAAFDRVAAELRAALAAPAAPTEGCELTRDLDRCCAADVELVGGKMAHLGELRGALGLPAPDGFAVTTAAYWMLIDAAGGRDALRGELHTLFASDDAPRVARAVRGRILGGGVPPALADRLLAEFDRLAARLGVDPRALAVAVRSSAVEEDGTRSFAGQFVTRLGVRRDGLLEAYLEVVASLHSAEAIAYRMLAGLSGESAAMAVGVLAMVEAQSAGVVYSREPTRPGSPAALVQAVPGLGVAHADGSAIARTLRVDPAQGSVERDGHDGGELRDADALALALAARRLEEHFGTPQDVEWARGRQGLQLLQSRPLAIVAETSAREPQAGAELLLAGGEPACPGVGAGPAVHLDEDSDLDAFPAGAVLVAPRSSPRFVRVMGRAAAIVTDAGSTTGHMASLARELRVPALLATRDATRLIARGEVVTVDAAAARVYRGRVEELCATAEAARAGELASRAAGGRLRPGVNHALLERVAAHIVPLGLTDPAAPEFCPARCTSLHDLARYVHEKAYEEMFGIGQRVGDARAIRLELELALPIDLYVIDLGGGIRVLAPQTALREDRIAPGAELDRKRRLRPTQVSSLPFAALLRGMTHPKIPRGGPRPLDARGLFSIMMRHAVTNPEEEATFRDACYALVSDHYLNYTARVGYHFGVVDTFCSPSPNRNYVNLHFRGGAADIVRRCRRARLIGSILKALGMHTSVDRDMVSARLGRGAPTEIVDLLDQIGRLLQFVRQLDVAMVNEESVGLFRDAFLREDYSLSTLSAL